MIFLQGRGDADGFDGLTDFGPHLQPGRSFGPDLDVSVKPVKAPGEPIEAETTDIPGDTSTTATIAIGQTLDGTLGVMGDKDWYKITLTAGQTINISLFGSGATPVDDPFLRIYDAAGNLIASNDDGGTDLNSLLRLAASSGGVYYIEADSYNSSSTGQYSLSVVTAPPLQVFDNDQIANQLVSGFWDGAQRAFIVGTDGQITVNVSTLPVAQQNLATQALALWTDVTGISFISVTANAEITFQNTDEGAYATSVTSGTRIVSSTVNVSTQWVTDYGTALDGYTFQTFVHEIGHALGLGHAGNYNGDASYANDALYLNDSWATTIMSYFAQDENSYFSQLGFSYAPVTSPMSADVVAMAELYGLSYSTRTGNTTYGFNSNSNRTIHNATQFANTAYTVVDSGGIDTLDYSGFAAQQLIDLRPEQFMNIGGLTGNVSIARGTLIEHAKGGSGADTIIGNSAVNNLVGNGGDDVLLGGIGSDWLYGNMGNDQIDGGAGWDYLFGGNGNDQMWGGNGNDNLFGDAGADTIDGGGGKDFIKGSGGDDQISGGDGDDTLMGEWDNDTLRGGNGNDTIRGGTGRDWIDGGGDEDTIFGDDDNDTIYGGLGNDSIDGGAGHDFIDGGSGNDVLTGGLGNDTFAFSTYGLETIDTITDFQGGDKIGLDRSALFGTIENLGPLAEGAFRYGTTAQDADDRILYQSSTGRLFYDPDGVGGIDAVLFAQLEPRTELSRYSFVAFGDAMPPPLMMSDPALAKDAALLGADAHVI